MAERLQQALAQQWAAPGGLAANVVFGAGDPAGPSAAAQWAPAPNRAADDAHAPRGRLVRVVAYVGACAEAHWRALLQLVTHVVLYVRNTALFNAA